MKLPRPSLPSTARLPINRCNLPAVILGGQTYQRHPVALEIDGVAHLHKALFERLGGMNASAARAAHFVDYMAAHFCLDDLEAAGLSSMRIRKYRRNANYLRLVRGWSFDSDSREGAVLKLWTESRFGLQTRFHRGPLDTRDSEAYQAYLATATRGLYATNALESQLDLLYSYCQYELHRQHPGESHLRLYRGVNAIEQQRLMTAPCGEGCREGNDNRDQGCETRGSRRPRADADRPSPERRTPRRKQRNPQESLLLNNLSSFTSNPERACEFGDHILEIQVPLPKIFFYNALLPGLLKSEDEFVVIGGIYRPS